MLRSENLYEILDKYFSQIQKNSYYKREVQKFLMKKYEYSDIEYMQYIIGAKSKDEIPDNEMYWLIDAFNNVFRTNMEMKTYFSDKEIVRFSSLKADYLKTDIYPIRISPVIEIAEDQWVTKISIDLLKEFYDNQLIIYNPRTQRQLKQRRRGQDVSYTIDIVSSSVKAIEGLMSKGEFVPNALTLNLNVDDPEVDFDIVGSELILNSGKFDIIDGFHRFRAACQYIEQEDKRNKISKSYLASMDKSSPTNIIIDKLNNTLDSPVRGKIERAHRGEIDRATLFSLLEFILKTKNMNRSQCIKTAVFIINILKIVQENNPDVVFDDTTMPVVLYGSSISKDAYECAEKIESALGKDVPIINSVTNMKVNKIKALFEEV
jgi:CheY-like chemotaxis protein